MANSLLETLTMGNVSMDIGAGSETYVYSGSLASIPGNIATPNEIISKSLSKGVWIAVAECALQESSTTGTRRLEALIKEGSNIMTRVRYTMADNQYCQISPVSIIEATADTTVSVWVASSRAINQTCVSYLTLVRIK